MGRGGQEHFSRGQVLATCQCKVPYCQPLFGCAGIGTEGGGITTAPRSRGGGLVTCWELTMPFVFVGDCPPTRLRHCRYSYVSEIYKLVLIVFFKTTGGGAP